MEQPREKQLFLYDDEQEVGHQRQTGCLENQPNKEELLEGQEENKELKDYQKPLQEDAPPVPPETHQKQLTHEPTKDIDLKDMPREPDADPAENPIEKCAENQETIDEQEIPVEEKDQQSAEEQENTKLGLDKVFSEKKLTFEQVTQLTQEAIDEHKTLKEKDQQSEEEKNRKLGLNGEEEDLPNDQVTQFLRHLVAQLWPELGPNSGLRLERASAKGDNYLGVVWRLHVEASKSSLVVKLPPQNRVRRKQFFARPCFLRETAAYEDFLPLAEELQEKWQIPAEHRFRQHARCYGTRQDEPNECIVLEDLACTGFELHNRFVDLPEDHVRHVIRSYAKLHALSLAGKRQYSERMQRLQQLVDIFEQRREDHALGVYFENLKGSALSSLTEEEDDRYRVRLEEYFSRGSYFELLLPLVGGTNCEPFAVICHGDCWNNNILYQRGGVDGELKDVRLIDWQLMRYASPITDLAYFLFTCTSRGFRQMHLNQVLQEYYEELGQHLSRLEVFPFPGIIH
ncbi:hypothetical protein KR032_006151 [Drosophila birchii]|nr:hypothetical protein KR032_006151 [Drosophila birchii]